MHQQCLAITSMEDIVGCEGVKISPKRLVVRGASVLGC